MIIVAAAFAGFGIFLLVVSALMLTSRRKNHLQLRQLDEAVDDMRDRLRTPAERAALARRRERIEAEKRVVFGRYDNGGG